jgi:ATP-binding cassette subfamily B protein
MGGAFQFLRGRWMAEASESIAKNMRDRLYRHLQSLPFDYHVKAETGDLIQRCTSDVETIRRFLSSQVIEMFRAVLMIGVALVVMLRMNWKMTLMSMVLIPFLFAFAFLYFKWVVKFFRVADEAEGKMSAVLQENLTGVRVVRAFGRERHERDRFAAQNEHYTSLWVRLGRLMSFFWASADVLSGVQVMLVVVFGARFCLRGEMTSGEYIAFVSYNGMLVWPVRMLGRMIGEMSKARVGLRRIGFILDAEEERDAPDAVAPPLDGDIRFEHVSFAYDGCPETLHDIDLTIPAGTTLGILGGTGSGKSTLTYLLDRLYPLPPECGRITIGGVDIANIRLEHLRRNVGMVLQEPFLFSRTLRENLSVAAPELPEAELRAAAEAACLEETVAGFSKGYETFVGERGVTLSGGQKQRVAIARMLVRKAPIMVFDDSLSAVDTETDAKIRRALERTFGTATILLISHRITTLSKADQVLVLDHGRVSQLGTPEQLRNQPGLYRRIHDIQSASLELQETEARA